MAAIKTDTFQPGPIAGADSIGDNPYSDYNTSGYISEIVASRTYSDLHNSVIHPINGDALRATDLDAIYQSIKNIIMTPRGTRPFNYSFGSGVTSLLFEPATWVTITQLQAEIIESVTRLEPRLSNFDCTISYDPDANPHQFVAAITYQPYFGGIAETSFILNRIR